MNRQNAANKDIFTTVFTWIINFFLAIVAFFWSLLGSGTKSSSAPQRTLALPYGSRQPQFLQCTYQQALQTAREQHKFILLYLHSQNHQDTPRFCSEVLCTERVSTFLEDNFILWGGDVSTTPAFKLCNKYGTTNFPFIAVVANVTYNPSMVAFWHSMNYHPRITRSGEHLLYKKQGFVSEQDLINSLGEILELHQPLLHAARSERESRERDRILRDTQDEEYNRSVQEDLEKEQRRLREIEEERAREEEKIKEELMKEKEREREKEAKLQELLLQEERSQQVTEKKVEEKPNQSLPAPPPEPPKSSTTTDIKFRLSDGSTVIRRFSISELVSDLFLFVATKESIDNKVLTTSFPRKTYKFEQSPLTLQEAGLVPQALLVVEEPLF